MYKPVVLYIGLRYMRSRASDRFLRFVSWLSKIGIILGVMALVSVLSVMNGFERKLETKILGLMPQALVTSHEGLIHPKHIPASVPGALAGVSRVVPITTGDVVLQSIHSVSVGIMLGVKPSDPEPLFHYLTQARSDDLIAGQYRVIVGDALLRQLGVKIGDKLRLMVPSASQFTPMGRIPSQRIFTVVGTFFSNSEIDSYQFLVNQQDASRLMRYPDGYVTGWRLWLKQPLSVERTSNQPMPDALVWHDWRERKGELFQAVSMEKNMMGLLLSLIVTISSFNIITSLGLLVMEKQSEVAILQTQGFTRRQVMLVFIVQGASTGIVGALLGTGFGILLASQLNSFITAINALPDGVALPVAIEPLQVTMIALSSMAMALLSTIYPSWCAATLHPAKALRYE